MPARLGEVSVGLENEQGALLPTKFCLDVSRRGVCCQGLERHRCIRTWDPRIGRVERTLRSPDRGISRTSAYNRIERVVDTSDFVLIEVFPRLKRAQPGSDVARLSRPCGPALGQRFTQRRFSGGSLGCDEVLSARKREARTALW
ncbi:hypothetical protein [Aeromicrobium ginsengisoli]|uniref:Uncharacterized protein n=1 Tax=Aeromicrobium ginsengisoli TaxID=363867 RepID=A0A5M4FA55_9ACTN|nr:hypothetical protein [Aeromicrobium ginsengisoli]KAA1395149.1 hypothetical protein ESP70_013310 [Aeromicrobium ginsengisoli]